MSLKKACLIVKATNSRVGKRDGGYALLTTYSLEKPGIKPVSPGLKGDYYTTATL